MFDCLKSEMTSTQAVSEALFDNCEDYQNIQNSSCKVKILLDVKDHPTITITINITITMTITICPQSQSPLTITTDLTLVVIFSPNYPTAHQGQSLWRPY